MKRKIALMLMFIMIMSTTVAFADSNWGQNFGTWAKAQIWWIALVVIAVMAVKYAAKKMWAQLGGLVVLGGIVLVIVDGPDKLKTIGLALWNIIFQ